MRPAIECSWRQHFAAPVPKVALKPKRSIDAHISLKANRERSFVVGRFGDQVIIRPLSETARIFELGSAVEVYREFRNSRWLTPELLSAIRDACTDRLAAMPARELLKGARR